MARQAPGGGPPSQNTIYYVQDPQGNLILEVRQEEYIVLGPNSPPALHTRHQNIQLVCGTTWNPSMLQSKPPVFIGVCHMCRHPPVSLLGREQPSHGLVAMYRARLCADCGILCCPRHRRERDGKWRCLRCSARHGRVGLIRAIFFRREERE